MTARIDALNAQANAGVLEQNVVMARSRLAWLMGLPPDWEHLQAVFDKPPEVAAVDPGALIIEALSIRPDAVAAQWAVAAAAERAEVARKAFLRIDAVADANGQGLKGFEVGPGLRFDIPIFNRNQGGRMRADAEWQQALYNRDAVHDAIVQEIRMAAAQWTQAQNNLEILEGQVAPALREAQQIAERGFADGGTDYLLVLQTTSQYLDARARLLDQAAALRRARAELERSVGRSLGPFPQAPEFVEGIPLSSSLPSGQGENDG
jgi:cobalt-zinc-cadmium efflux system outer membrane protein